LLDDVAEIEGTREDSSNRRPREACVLLNLEDGSLEPLFDARHLLPARRAAETELAVSQRLQGIAQRGRPLEVEVRGRGLHLVLDPGNLGIQFRLGAEHLARLA